jgi:hypothetical protein
MLMDEIRQKMEWWLRDIPCLVGHHRWQISEKVHVEWNEFPCSAEYQNCQRCGAVRNLYFVGGVRLI